MIQQVTHYSQTASGPCAPIGGAIKHAQSLRDFPSAPLLQNAWKLVYMPYFSWGKKKLQGPIRSAMINFAVLSKFGTTFKTILMNHISNRLEICYRCVEYMSLYRVKLNKKCNTKCLKGVSLCQ